MNIVCFLKKDRKKKEGKEERQEKEEKSDLLCCSSAGELQSHWGECPQVRLHDQVKVGQVNLKKGQKIEKVILWLRKQRHKLQTAVAADRCLCGGRLNKRSRWCTERSKVALPRFIFFHYFALHGI